MTARTIIAALAALGLGCSYHADTMISVTSCATDDECAEGEVCFPDGCADPGKGIAVELLPSASGGQLIQDIALEKISAVQDLVAGQPSVVTGSMQQATQSIAPVPYQGEVTFSAHGESLIIPGRTRTLTYNVVPEKGAFQVPIHSGRYTISLVTKDSIYPPMIFPGQTIDPGAAQTLDATFPSVSQLMQVTGYLLKTSLPRVAIQNAQLDVQAFDAVTGDPISQRASVSSGTSVSDGSFVLWIQPQMAERQIVIKALPRVANQMAPSKTFSVPLSSNLGDLELGDYGVPVAVTGRVLANTTLAPVADARVHIEGTVHGGGTFKGPSTNTDANGVFTLTTLPSGVEGHLDVIAEPPVKADAGQVRYPVRIPIGGGDIGDVIAPDKVQLLGTLARPDGSPAAGVAVQAEALNALSDDLPIPQGLAITSTDDAGSFTLKLDPGEYRLDFLPTDQLPRVSRFVRVDPPAGYSGEGYAPISLPQFVLSRGRTVSGTVKSIPSRLATEGAVPAPYASLKFFRVVSFGGKPSSILLAEGIADQNGHYKIVLPTR